MLVDSIAEQRVSAANTRFFSIQFKSRKQIVVNLPIGNRYAGQLGVALPPGKKDR
jgi:hypothetical protein